MFNHINRDIVKWKVRSLSWHFKIKTITQTPCYFSPCSTMEENLTSIVHVFQDNLKFSIPQWNKKFMILRCLVLPLYCWNISWSKRADHFYPFFFFFLQFNIQTLMKYLLCTSKTNKILISMKIKIRKLNPRRQRLLCFMALYHCINLYLNCRYFISSTSRTIHY